MEDGFSSSLLAYGNCPGDTVIRFPKAALRGLPHIAQNKYGPSATFDAWLGSTFGRNTRHPVPTCMNAPACFASAARSNQRSLAIFFAINTTQGMQYDQPCCWNAHIRATMLDNARTMVGDDNGFSQLVEQQPIILV